MYPMPCPLWRPMYVTQVVGSVCFVVAGFSCLHCTSLFKRVARILPVASRLVTAEIEWKVTQ